MTRLHSLPYLFKLYTKYMLRKEELLKGSMILQLEKETSVTYTMLLSVL